MIDVIKEKEACPPRIQPEDVEHWLKRLSSDNDRKIGIKVAVGRRKQENRQRR